MGLWPVSQSTTVRPGGGGVPMLPRLRELKRAGNHQELQRLALEGSLTFSLNSYLVVRPSLRMMACSASVSK